MPLQESFGKKSHRNEPVAATRTRVLTNAPGLEDLRYTLISAQSAVRQPIAMTWRRNDSAGGYLLTVTRNSSEISDPTWMLHADEGDNTTNIIWSYTTSDADLIHSLLNEEVNREAPAAVIPEDLRPRAPQVDAEHLLGCTDQQSGAPQYFENYEILETLGRGGMGIIYKAHNHSDGRIVALKVLRMDLLLDQVSVRRFEQEAAVASSLVHPNLIRVREFGLSRYGQPYLTMDYIDGIELQQQLAASGHLTLPAFVNIFTQICDALAYAHDKGLIHRDLKPGNIMLVKRPGCPDAVHIIDFGIAKMIREQTRMPNITTTGEMLGSPAYMSPEQCGGIELDSRSDIYSLGCVMYEAISGVLPFRAPSVIGTIVMQVNDQPPALDQVRPELNIPDELQQIIYKALAKDPCDRYQTATELGQDLWSFAARGFPSHSAPRRATAGDAHLAVIESSEPSEPAPRHNSLQTNLLSDRTFTYLRQLGVLPDALLANLLTIERLVEQQQFSDEVAVQIITATQQGMPLKEALDRLVNNDSDNS